MPQFLDFQQALIAWSLSRSAQVPSSAALQNSSQIKYRPSAGNVSGFASVQDGLQDEVLGGGFWFEQGKGGGAAAPLHASRIPILYLADCLDHLYM
jgi:hypothetical protein